MKSLEGKVEPFEFSISSDGESVGVKVSGNHEDIVYGLCHAIGHSKSPTRDIFREVMGYLVVAGGEKFEELLGGSGKEHIVVGKKMGKES